MFTGQPHSTGCSVCGKTQVYSRGLCEPHYRRFNKEYKRVADLLGNEVAEKMDELAVEQGWALKKSKGGRKRDEDPFTELAEMILSESSEAYATERNRLIAEGNEVIQKEVAKARAKSPTKSKRKSEGA
jgi:hypothetical protein